MYKCKLCGKEFTDNEYKGGLLTRHIKEDHNISKKEYVVQTEYGGDPPKCQCGLCDEHPKFYRGDFKDYAKGHRSHEWKRKRYLELYGPPICDYNECENEVEFRRGEPKKYCSHKCAGKDNGGFTQEKTQDKIKKVCKEKYGVENPSELDSVREKISEKQKGKSPWDAVDDEEKIKEWKGKIGKAIKEKWENDDEYRKKMENRMKELFNDSDFIDKYFSAVQNGLTNKLSSLHEEVVGEYNLRERGFEPEKQIGKYIVDELNEDEKKIIEVFGDYVHANPEKFDADDIIKLPGNSYTAQEKWDHDQQKIEYLESQGYDVKIIWESEIGL